MNTGHRCPDCDLSLWPGERCERCAEAEAEAPLFLVWSRKREAWWGPNRCGYTTDRTAAGRYTEAEARQIEAQSAYGPEALRSVAVSEADAAAVVA